MVYSEHSSASKKYYEKDYFLEEYKNQYGKSYYEDEPKLRKLALQRVQILLRYLKPKASLLEIGCATGFFLDEARKAGYTVKGIELSKYASSSAIKRFGLEVENKSFENIPLSSLGKWDSICAFYTCEHFRSQKNCFEKISKSLHKGGAFCFALPSMKGPLFRHHRKEWENSHPRDHFADYTPMSIKKTLEIYDMKLIHIKPSSYHPERHPFFRRGYLSPLYRMYADRRSYGDTMSGIALKMTNPPVL